MSARWTSLCLSFLLPLLLVPAPAAQNSTAKLRQAPTDLAQRSGSAISWRSDLEAALAEAAESGRPVFWYVPSLEGSPMDRQPEVDRYMRAGPFSWPRTIALLEEHFVPVAAVADREDQERFGLAPREFIEPGWLVLAADGSERARLDRITTFEPDWFDRPLMELAGLETLPERGLPEDLADLWELLRSGDFAGVVDRARRANPAQWGTAHRAELAWLIGVGLWAGAGQDEPARVVWRQAGQAWPDEPWAWKAAMEAEGHGPFVRGFEVYGRLPEMVLTGPRDGSRAPSGSYTESELRDAAAAFFRRMRRDSGGFEDSIYDFGGTDSLPNVYVAVTALAARVGASVTSYVFDDAFLAREDRDEIVWAHIYRIRLLCHLLREGGGEGDPGLRGHLERIVGDLIALQPDTGAWFHEYPNPFVIASVLVALKDAADQGIPVDAAVVEKGAKALVACRARDGAYTYGYRPGGSRRANIPGSAGRMPLCEHALSLWGFGEEGALEAALRAAFEHHPKLAAVRKYDDHADSLGYGGFFFWYDMHSRTEAILHLPEGELRSDLVARQKQLILDLPEIDGCFVDSHELGRVYGTAMAMLCLEMLGGT